MRYFIFFFISFTLFACQEGLPTDDVISQKPENLLSKEVFVDLYYDTQLTEAAIRIEIGKGAKAKEVSAYLYEQLFKKYGITNSDFQANIKYYASDPRQMSKIQTEVVNRLTKNESKLRNQ